MNRNLLVAVAVLVLAAVGVRMSQEDDAVVGGCDGVRHAHEQVVALEASREVPTADIYAATAQEVRRAAVAAPSAVSPHLHAVADAYGQLSIHFRGFDPADPSTYALIEQRTPEIEREEARVDEAAARVAAWLAETCDG